MEMSKHKPPPLPLPSKVMKSSSISEYTSSYGSASGLLAVHSGLFQDSTGKTVI